MNFKRIEWIFLIAFILIDIFLFASYSSDTQFKFANNNSVPEDNVLKEMRNDQITVGALSTKSRDGYYIASSNQNVLNDQLGTLTDINAHFNGTMLVAEFKDPITVNSKKTKKTLDSLLKDNHKIAYGRSYTYNKYLSDPEHKLYIYSQKAPGGMMYGTSGSIRFKMGAKNELTGYSQDYLADLKPLREKDPVISQKKAVIGLYQYNEIPNNSNIRWAHLGYTKLLSLSDSNVFVPTWLVSIKTKGSGNYETKRINAFTGVVIKSDDNTVINNQQTNQ